MLRHQLRTCLYLGSSITHRTSQLSVSQAQAPLVIPTMKAPSFITVICLGLLARLPTVMADSQLFSKFAGAPTITAAFQGPSASLQSTHFTICTNFLHGLPNPDTLAITSIIPQLQQQEADGVCQVCTSLDISRVDSCCAQPTSVACFQQFAAVGATPTDVASTPANTKASNGVRIDTVRGTWGLRTDANNSINLDLY